MLRALSLCAAAALAVIASPAVAQSPLDGTWKIDPASKTIESKPDQFEVKGGMFNCSTCIPPLAVKADGQFHPVKDRPYWDEIAVLVVNSRTLRSQYRKEGRVVGETRRQLSDDGNQLTVATINTNNAAELPITSTTVATRVGPAPEGAHAASGQWKVVPTTSVSDAASTMTIKVVGDRVQVSTATGETLNATVGGPAAVNVGNPGKLMTKVERPEPNAIRLTDMLMGKVSLVSTYTVSGDGTTLNAEWQDPRDGSHGTFVARKQP